MIVGKPLHLNTIHCKPLFLVFIYIFSSLNYNMNGLHRKYFSVEVVSQLFCGSCFTTIHKLEAANAILTERIFIFLIS